MSDLLEELLKTPRKRPAPPTTIRPLIELLALPTPQDWEARQTFEEEIRLAQKAFHAEHPRGLTKAELNFDLTASANFAQSIAEKLSATPRVARYFDSMYDVADKMRKQWLDPLDTSVFAQWIEKEGHRLCLYELAPFCTFAEISRLAHESFYSGALTDTVYANPLYMFVHKLKLSAWHWGHKTLEWDQLVKFHRLLMNFDMGLPGFEVTFDHSHSWMNQRGWAEYTGQFQREPTDPKTKPWLDGELGLIISFNGEHVMTVGVSPTVQGLLVNQIQLAKKKGNRWLYRLPKPHFEHVLEHLQTACESQDIDMYLVTGESLRDQIKSLYKDLPFNYEAGEHIRKAYNQPLVTLARSRSTTTVNGHKYRQVRRKANAYRAQTQDATNFEE